MDVAGEPITDLSTKFLAGARYPYGEGDLEITFTVPKTDRPTYENLGLRIENNYYLTYDPANPIVKNLVKDL